MNHVNSNQLSRIVRKLTAAHVNLGQLLAEVDEERKTLDGISYSDLENSIREVMRMQQMAADYCHNSALEQAERVNKSPYA